LGRYARFCYEQALTDCGISAEALRAGRARIQPGLVVSRLCGVIGPALRKLALLAFPVLWWTGVRDPLSLLTIGSVAATCAFVLGGLVRGVFLLFPGRGPYSRLLHTGRHLWGDGLLIRYATVPFAVLVTIVASFRWRSSWSANGLFTASLTGLAWGLAFFAVGYLLSQLGLITGERGFRDAWNTGAGPGASVSASERRDTDRALGRERASDRTSTFSAINFVASFVTAGYLIVYGVVPLLFLLLLKPFSAASAGTSNLIAALALPSGMLLARDIAKRVSMRLLRAARRDVSIVILRRFDGAISSYIRHVVAPTFGAYGNVKIVNDESYRKVGEDSTNILQRRVYEVLDFAGGYYETVTFEDDWVPKVEALMRRVSLCVIDVSILRDGVVTELRLALRNLPADRVILIAHNTAVLNSNDNLFTQVCDRVIDQQSDRDVLTAGLRQLRPPMLYGYFVASAAFKWRIYRRFRELVM
jgi:hypothetical protein